MSNTDAALSWCERNLSRNGSLQRDGRTWLCSNPTRGDRNPSLSVDIGKRVWHDFATNESGTLSELSSLLGCEAPAWELEGSREEKEPAHSRAKPDKSDEVTRLWQSGRPAQADHPHLLRKKVGAHSCRESTIAGERVLLVPAYNEQGHVVGCERIKPDGSKAHLGTKSGSFFLLGAVEAGRPVAIAEGYSTSAAIHEFSGLPTACAFGAGNVPTLARRLRERYPDVEIVLAVDRDDAGEKAIRECGAGFLPCIPDGAAHCDWDDVACLMGRDETRRLFDMKLESARAKAPKKKALRSIRSTLVPERGVKPEMIGGIFPRGGVSILAGQQGSGKSLLMQKFCSDASLGGEILSGVSLNEAPRKIVYFVGELPVDTMNDRQRTTAWGFDPKMLVLYSRIEASKNEIALDLTDAEGFKNIVAVIREEKPDLVAFDSLMSFATIDESDMKAMQSVFSKLVRLAGEEKIAVVLIHHIRKRKGVERQGRLHMDDVIGSSIITRNASVAVGVESVKQDDGTESVHVTNLKSWYAPLDEFAFSIIRDDFKVLRGIEIELDPESPSANKAEAIKQAVFKGHADGSSFSVAGIASLTGATDRYVRRLFREWMNEGTIEARGGGKDTLYNIMEKFRKGASPLANTHFSAGTAVPDSSGTVPEQDCFRNWAVPERNPVIATAEGPFRNKPMISGDEISVPRTQPVEAPKIERNFPSRGANVPLPLVEESEAFPSEMELPHLWRSKSRWIVAIQTLGDGSRSFGLSPSKDGKPKVWLREPQRFAA